MAKMVCVADQIINPGEKALYFSLKDFLSDSHIVYWNREVFGHEFDYCILLPEIGILVVEVKGWSESTVIDIPGGNYIRIQTESGIEKVNPRVQARNYRFALLNHIKMKLGKRPLVFHMVCYPFISSAYYESSQMNLITEPELTLLQEDLVDQQAFLSKLDKGISFARRWGEDPFNSLLMRQVRSLFEPEDDIIDENSNRLDERIQFQHDRLMPTYSIFSYIPAEDDWEEEIDYLIMMYAQGTRIQCIVGTHEMLEYISIHLDKCLQTKGLRIDKKGNLELGEVDHLSTKGNKIAIFNWNCIFLPMNETISQIPRLRILDANNISDSLINKWLKLLDEEDGFNYKQYETEHACINKNVLVKAGAGTGKTYTMIQRIMFLCYSERIPSTSLVDKIVMITFTNEAANNMKQRLKVCLQNYYLLTSQQEFLEMVAKVDLMQICTIHSYALNIIKKLGTSVGYGKDLKIASGSYNRKLVVQEVLENYVDERVNDDPEYLNNLGIPIYELRKKLMDFVGKLENKSVDVTETPMQRFGEAFENPLLHTLIAMVISNSEADYNRNLSDENRIFLGRLMVVLAHLVERYPERLYEQNNEGSRYLFIDEFQDTDDVQIEVIKKLCVHLRYKLFVVGDIKQCIYRFRGAEERAFDRLEVNETEWDKEKSLQKNYRTDKRLLNIYQEFFEVWGNLNNPLLTYETDDELYSSLVFNKDDDPERSFFNPIYIDNEQQRMDVLFEEISQSFAELRERIENNQHLSKEERTIAILVRENWQAENIVREGQRRSDIQPIESNTGGDLYKSAPALDLSSLLQALLYGRPEHLSHLLQSNFFRISYDKMKVYKLRSNSTEEQISYLIELVDNMLSRTADTVRTYNSWSEVLDSLKFSPVLQVIRSLYNQLRPWLNYGENDWLKSYYRMNVDSLIEKILQGCGFNDLTLHQLTNFIVNNIVTERQEDCRYPDHDEKDIRILCITVHKSKGLEYGHVILPYASFSINQPKQNSMDIMVRENGDIGYKFNYSGRRQLRNTHYNTTQELIERTNEECRVLYVAMTRAIRKFSWVDLTNSRNKSWQSLLRMRRGGN